MLSSLKLENFKSFKSTVVNFGAFTLILGTNASGKSNLFDALRLLHFLGQGSSVRDAIDGYASSTPAGISVPGIRGGSQSLAYLGSESSECHLTIEIQHSDYGKVRYSVGIDVARHQICHERLTASKSHPGTYVFNTHPEAAPLLQNPDSPGILARFYTNAPGRDPKKEFSAHQTILSQFVGRQANSLQNERVADVVRQELAGLVPLELRPEVLRQYANIGSFEMGEHGENFAAIAWLVEERANTDLDDYPETSQERVSQYRYEVDVITSWLSELTPHPIHSFTTLVAPTGEVIFAVHEDPFEEAISARSLSDGTLRFAALTFALFSQHRRRTLMIEEVENGINPNRLHLLSRMLETATTRDSGIQVIATAHAPALLDFISEENLRDVIVMGWDSEQECSNPVRIRDMEAFESARQSSDVSGLQQSGWLQLAADL